MDAEVKQRNRRRKRAQRMQAQRDMTKNADSNEEDESPVREKPPRPPNRRKKSKEPLVEEDIIDGFAILGFKTYEDLETVLKIANKENVRRLVEIERPKHEPRPHITHHISAHPPHGLTLTQDPATSDDSGRASERLTGSSVAPRDADSSRDRLSDASSRCSSGKGYICDSEGDDDKQRSVQGTRNVNPEQCAKSVTIAIIVRLQDGGRDESAPQEKEGRQETVETPLTSPSDEIQQGSDASSVIFGSTPGSRKHEFPGALPPSLPSLNNGTSSSPVPAPTPPDLPAPSPAPAQLPPPPPVPRHVIIEEKRPPEAMTVTPSSLPSPAPAAVAPPPPPVAVPNPPVAAAAPPPNITNMAMSMPQPAAAPVVHHPPALGSSTPGTNTSHARTESPAVATSAPAYHPPYQPLYAPYAATVHTPYSSAVAVPTTTPTAAATTVTASTHPAATSGPPTPRGHSPARERERESYSNVSSLSRTSVTPQSCPPPTTTTVSSSLTNKPWTGPSPQHSPAPRPTPPLHSAPSYAPMFATPLPPAATVSRASPTVAPPPTNPNPFSAESLFQQSNQADMLRRELDNRFLASQDSRGMNVAPPPYLRTEMHQHQHHHTHVHQHTTSLLPPPPSSSLYPSPLFKEIPKLGSHESPFYRQNIGLPPSYPGYTPSLLHPGLTGPTPFAPPSHLPAFQPKPSTAEQPTKPKITKSGKWNAMHVRVAWEIYHHQHKGDKGGPGALKGDLLRPPTHLFNPSVRSHELTSFPPTMGHRPPPPTFEQPPHPGSLFTSPASHIGKPISLNYFDPLKAKNSFTGSTMSPFTRYGGAGPGYGAAPGASPFSVSAFPPSAAGRPNELPPLLHDPWRRSFPPNLPPTLPPNPWSMKPDPLMEQREREERERERLRREREERERREREEKRRIEQQQAEQRERERREKERREMEQRERERMLHQQRLVDSAKPLQAVIRDRSPMRNGDVSEIRIKEEPRSKEDEATALLRTATDPRYHPYLRAGPPHSMQPPLSRVLPPSGLTHHYAPPSSHWPPPPADAFYRYEHLRYNPLVDVMRAEEERVKMFGSYHPPHPSQLRTKDPGLMHLRPGPGPGPPPTHKMCATPPTDLHKKEEPR